MRSPEPRVMSWLRLVCVIVFGAGVLVQSPAASAHADLVSSSPAAGAVLTQAPAEVTLTFTDRLIVDGVQVSIVAADGSVVTSDPPRVTDSVVTLPWPDTAGPGEYQVGYRVVSADGHPVTGDLTFAIAVPSGGQSPTATNTTMPSDAPSTDPTPPSEQDSTPGGTAVPLAIALVAAGAVAVAAALALRRRNR